MTTDTIQNENEVIEYNVIGTLIFRIRNPMAADSSLGNNSSRTSKIKAPRCSPPRYGKLGTSPFEIC